MELAENDISGTLSSNMWTMNRLRVLNLLSNHMRGTFPDLPIGNETQIERVNLGSNELTGVLPSNLMNWASLQVLFLNDNNFHGSIPEIGLSALSDLWLQDNELTGTLPTFEKTANLGKFC